jgi:hypothetical protein
MAFATIEDIQGIIDLVIFPRTWAKYAEIIRFDEIIYVQGKADTNGSDTKVLVDKVSTNITQFHPAGETGQRAHQSEPPRQERPAPKPAAKPAPIQEPQEKLVVDEPDEDLDLGPLPDFPPLDYEDVPVVSNGHEEIGEESPSEPAIEPALETTPRKAVQEKNIPEPEPALETPPAPEPSPQPEPELEVEKVETPEPVVETLPDTPREIVTDLDEDSTYLVTVILKNRGDTMRDKLRLRQIYGTLISYPGKDRFVFQIMENDHTHLLEFPNATTKLSKNLLNQLRDMLGRENVQVERYLL